MRPTIFLLLPYYDWFFAIVSSSTGSPNMSYVTRFCAFPAVVRVSLSYCELLSVFHWPWNDFFYDKLWNVMHSGTQLSHHCSSFLQYWILCYWLSGRYPVCIPHRVCLWQELLPLNGNHASSLYVLHRKTTSISSFSYRRIPSYYLPCCFLTDVAHLLMIFIQSSSFFQTRFIWRLSG